MRLNLGLPMAAIGLLLAVPLRAEVPAAAAHEFHVTGMTCDLFGKAIEKNLRAVEGLRNVQIDRRAARIRVIASQDLGADRLETAIESEGRYHADLVIPGATGPDNR